MSMMRWLLTLVLLLSAPGCQRSAVTPDSHTGPKWVQVGLYGFNGKVSFYLDGKKMFERRAQTSGFSVYEFAGTENIEVNGCQDVKILYRSKRFESRMCFDNFSGLEVYNDQQITVSPTNAMQGTD